MKNLGDFTRYEKPDNPLNILYFKNASGVDWYSLNEEQGSAFALVTDGLVTSVAADITTLVPDGQSVIVIEEGETVPLTGWAFDGSEFIAPPPDPTTDPNAPPPLIPLSPFQFRQALIDRDLRQHVPDVIASIEDAKTRQRMQDAWDTAQSYDPESPLTVQMAGLFIAHPLISTINDMDAFWTLWREAMAITDY